VKCSECGCHVEVQIPEPDVGIVGAAACDNEDCPKFEVDVWEDYMNLHLDEDGNMPKRRLFR
jgi:hypothetical protein